MEREEDQVVPYTVRDRRRSDRLERAVFGYADEGGAFVPGLLQNTNDLTSLAKKITTIVTRLQWAGYLVLALALFNSLHLYGIADAVKAVMTGGK